MAQTLSPHSRSIASRSPRYHRRHRRFPLGIGLLATCVLMVGGAITFKKASTLTTTTPLSSLWGHLPPLAMEGGDPYLRALLRTISASEANARYPYGLLYGGQHIHDFSQHPNVCIPIKTQVNQGHCSTAAGRYQFLTHTWQEKAARYHPAPQRVQGKTRYSFEPQYQDWVTYRWLDDRQQWSIDIAKELRQGNLESVFKHLSGTWTSLGYGIEDNRMTASLPHIYQRVLAEELQHAPDQQR